MSFEVFKPRVKGRQEEVKRMLEALALSEQLAAKIDMSVGSVYYYAKKLGFKVWTKDNYDGTSTVKVVAAPKSNVGDKNE